ncbi:unnamed protein product [Victoria cruziana]
MDRKILFLQSTVRKFIAFHSFHEGSRTIVILQHLAMVRFVQLRLGQGFARILWQKEGTIIASSCSASTNLYIRSSR